MHQRCITNPVFIAQIRRFLFTLLLLVPTGLLAGPPADDSPNQTQTVNINAATIEQLVELPGIGPHTARRIIRYRNKRPFASVRQLRRIKGIGRKKYLRLRNLVKAGPAAPTRSDKNGGQRGQ